MGRMMQLGWFLENFTMHAMVVSLGIQDAVCWGCWILTIILDQYSSSEEFSLERDWDQCVNMCSYYISNLNKDLAQEITCRFLVCNHAGVGIGSQLFPWLFCELFKLILFTLSSEGRYPDSAAQTPRMSEEPCTTWCSEFKPFYPKAAFMVGVIQ